MTFEEMNNLLVKESKPHGILEDWTVHACQDGKTIELETGVSASGEDWIISLCADDQPICDQFSDLYEDFDVEEDVCRALDAKRCGLEGVPRIEELLAGAKEKQEELRWLRDAFEYADR